jgi:hypothetical protein
MAIPASQFRRLFTQAVVEIYREKTAATSFLSSFFREKVNLTRFVSIEVQRGTEKVAVDVKRHTDGNLNVFDLSTEKIWEPPYYDEFIVANKHHLYDMAIGAQSDTAFAELAAATASDLFDIEQKILRAYEVQASQVLETGVVQLINYTNIDFNRKATSLVDTGGGTYWASAVNPFEQIEEGCKFLRQTGKAMGGRFNMLCGNEAFADLITNVAFLTRNDLQSMRLDGIAEPQRNAVGATYMGYVTAGSYIVDIWVYEQYRDVNGVSTPYWNPKKICILPQNNVGVLSYGAVPQLIGENGTIPQSGKFLMEDFIDPKRTSHEIHLKSAGLVVPVQIDMMYTRTVVA